MIGVALAVYGAFPDAEAMAGTEPIRGASSAGRGDHADAQRTAAPGVSRSMVVLLAAAVGAAVANRYYIEPLLSLVAGKLRVSDTAAGLLVTCAQVGYVLGLALLVPLGDLAERRRLITIMLLGAGVAAAACAAAPGLFALASALVVLGLCSVAAQILIPFAADLAAEHERGRVVGSVTSGLLIGILAARTVAGLAADVGGFRLTFALAAAVMITFAVILCRVLPSTPTVERRGYWALLGSVVELVAAEPVLRQRMILGLLQMAGFAVLWTPSAFLLSGPPYHYRTVTIGLFGLVGAAGVSCAPAAGRLADRGHGRLVLTGCLVITLVSWALLALGRTSLVALVAGIVLLDLGAQAAQVNHQSAIYALGPGVRSRLNAAYMVTFCLGGVLGSLTAATVYGVAGWTGTCLLGAGIAATALVVWLSTQRIGSRAHQARRN